MVGALGASELQLGQGLVVVVAPQPSMQGRAHLHLDSQEGNQEAVQPGIAGQCVRGLAAHPELRDPLFLFHGVLHGRGNPEGFPPVVHCRLAGGFGRPAAYDHVCPVGGHGGRDPVLGRRLPSRRGLLQ